MPASSTSATAWPACSRWRATTTRATSSPIRARRPASAASCATSSPWARGRSPASTRSPSARRRTPRPGTWCPASSPASAAMAIPSACRRSAAQVRFHTRYDGNILVNAMAVGLAETDKIFYAAASGVNMPIVYLGSKTGRDGIHGASMASAEFDDDSAEKRPTVQVGDPFSGKAAAGSLPRNHGEGLRDRDPGHGRGGPHLLGGRDGRQGRSRRRRSISTRCRAARPA